MSTASLALLCGDRYATAKRLEFSREVLAGLLAGALAGAYMLRVTLAQYRDACLYTLAIPRRFVRLRLACLWPIMIGLETLELLAAHDAWLDPASPAKVPRKRIYRIMASSLALVGSNTAIRARMNALIDAVDARIAQSASR